MDGQHVKLDDEVDVIVARRDPAGELLDSMETGHGDRSLADVESLLGAREEDNLPEVDPKRSTTLEQHQMGQENRQQEQMLQNDQFQMLMAAIQGQANHQRQMMADHQRQMAEDQVVLQRAVGTVQATMGTLQSQMEARDQVIRQEMDMMEKSMEKRMQQMLAQSEQQMMAQMDQFRGMVQAKGGPTPQLAEGPQPPYPQSAEIDVEQADSMAFVTQARGINAPYGFTDDQQGFSALDRVMQGKKGMVAARMPAPLEPSNSLSRPGPPTIAKELTYREAMESIQGSQGAHLSPLTSRCGIDETGPGEPAVQSTPPLESSVPPLAPHARVDHFTPAPRDESRNRGTEDFGGPHPYVRAVGNSPPYVGQPGVGPPYPMWNVTPIPPPKRNRNPGVTLGRFTGKEALQDFLLQVENAARIGDWDEMYKAGRLYGQLAGSALRVANALPEEQRQDYQMLKRALQDRFEGELQKDRSKEELRACRRRKGESLMELGHRITELARKAYTEGQRDSEGVLAFRGAISEELGKVLVTARPRSVDEAIDIVAPLEVYLENNRQDKRQGVIRQVQEDPTPSVGQRGNGPMDTGRSGKTNPATQRPKEGGVNRGQLPPPRDQTAPPPANAPVTLTPQQVEMIANQLERRFVQLYGPPAGNPVPMMAGGTGQNRPALPPGPPNMGGPNWGRGPAGGPANPPRPNRGPCFTCGSNSHWSRECPERNAARPTNGPNLQGNVRGLGLGPHVQPRQ